MSPARGPTHDRSRCISSTPSAATPLMVTTPAAPIGFRGSPAPLRTAETSSTVRDHGDSRRRRRSARRRSRSRRSRSVSQHRRASASSSGRPGGTSRPGRPSSVASGGSLARSLAQGLGQTTDGGRDDRETVRERLGHDHPVRLDVGGQHEEVGGGIRPLEVGAVQGADEVHAIGQPLRLELSPKRATTSGSRSSAPATTHDHGRSATRASAATRSACPFSAVTAATHSSRVPSGRAHRRRCRRRRPVAPRARRPERGRTRRAARRGPSRSS